MLNRPKSYHPPKTCANCKHHVTRMFGINDSEYPGYGNDFCTFGEEDGKALFLHTLGVVVPDGTCDEWEMNKNA